MNLDFLRLVLLQIRLSLQATNLFMGCVTSSNVVVRVNGEPTIFFRSSHGFRQGCPLSHLLFLLVM